MVFPLGISLYYQERSAVIGFLLSMGILGLTGLFLSNIPSSSPRLKAREAILIVTIGWVVVSFFAALPFVLSGSAFLVDAFFEAVSGLTTTGASVLRDVEGLPKGVLFWRSLLHWLGGMGILVLTLAILPILGVVGFQVFKAESPGPSPDKFTPRIAATSKILYTIYGVLTAAILLGVRAAGVPWFESFVLAFGTVSTGGFGLYSDSLARWSANSPLIVLLAAAMFLAGVNFSLYYDLAKGRWRQALGNAELRWYVAIMALSVLTVALNLYGPVYGSIGEALKQAWFQVGSVMTTTGYSTVDFDLWPSFSKGILFTLMFVGASAGSTSGSVKVVRLLVAAKVVKRELSRVLHPRAAKPAVIGGRVMPPGGGAGGGGFSAAVRRSLCLGFPGDQPGGTGSAQFHGRGCRHFGQCRCGLGCSGPPGQFCQLQLPGQTFSFLPHASRALGALHHARGLESQVLEGVDKPRPGTGGVLRKV